MRKGGDSGPAVAPGDSAKSRLFLAVTAADGVKPMPPTGQPLDAAQVAVLKAWIDAGAAAPVDEVAAVNKHWSFRPVVRPAEPAVKNEAWVRNPIDRFVLARLEKEGVAPSPEADRAMLIRRLSLDLLGLPPSPKEVDDFLADKAPDAYEKLVDRLLASPHYGERWGRHWLDLARYADSNGYSIDAPALHLALPRLGHRRLQRGHAVRPVHDRAAGRRPAARTPTPDAARSPPASTATRRSTRRAASTWSSSASSRSSIASTRPARVFLGLTVGCCQCHDHKFDPISQREYYQLFAFFNSVDEPKLELPTPEQTAKRAEVQAKIDARGKAARRSWTP